MFNPRSKGADLWGGATGNPVNFVVVTGQVTLFTVIMYNPTAADRYIMAFPDLAVRSLVGVDSPVMPPIRVPAHSQGSLDYGSTGRHSSGLQVFVSTTETTLTVPTPVADCWIEVGYRKRSA